MHTKECVQLMFDILDPSQSALGSMANINLLLQSSWL